MVTAEGLLAMMGWQMLNNDESTKVVSDEDAHLAVKTVEAKIYTLSPFPSLSAQAAWLLPSPSGHGWDMSLLSRSLSKISKL